MTHCNIANCYSDRQPLLSSSQPTVTPLTERQPILSSSCNAILYSAVLFPLEHKTNRITHNASVAVIDRSLNLLHGALNSQNVGKGSIP